MMPHDDPKPILKSRVRQSWRINCRLLRTRSHGIGNETFASIILKHFANILAARSQRISKNMLILIRRRRPNEESINEFGMNKEIRGEVEQNPETFVLEVILKDVHLSEAARIGRTR
jgi:hypothetical protein